MSAHGRYVVFSSSASDLVPNDTNGQRDVFVRDRAAGRTTLASVGPDGFADNGAHQPENGRFVAYLTEAIVSVHDRKKNTTRVVSQGVTVDPRSVLTDFAYLSFSDDGRYLLSPG